MNDLLKLIKDRVGLYIIEQGFTPFAKQDFKKKTNPYNREELISFYGGKRRGSSSKYSYINITCGIYYKDINKADKKIIDDSINTYPIIAGSIGHFRKSKPGYLNIPISDYSEIDEVSNVVIDNIDAGAFNLFNTYPTLDAIIEGVKRGDDWLRNYHNALDIRRAIRFASIINIVEAKESAIKWFSENAPNKDKRYPELVKVDILRTMSNNW